MNSEFITDCNTRKDGKKIREYNLWRNMRVRCVTSEKDVTYNGCDISPEFKVFSKFKVWCNSQIGFDKNGWQLDKDIIVKGSRLYSPETCCFVPRDINNLFTLRGNFRGTLPIGVHRSWKEGMYIARIVRYGKGKHLGWYSDVEKAFQAYKEAKETYIKEVAEKWKGQVDTRVYEALMNWEINIDD